MTFLKVNDNYFFLKNSLSALEVLYSLATTKNAQFKQNGNWSKFQILCEE